MTLSSTSPASSKSTRSIIMSENYDLRMFGWDVTSGCITFNGLPLALCVITIHEGVGKVMGPTLAGIRLSGESL